jgi:hypothetical protein
MRKRLIRNVVLTASCLAATVVPAQSAIAQTASFEAVGGTLLAKGAAVRITFTYTCADFPSFITFEQFQITQRAGNSLSTGTGFAHIGPDLICDGVQRTGQVDIAAQDSRFKKGLAFVSSTGELDSFSNEVRIK